MLSDCCMFCPTLLTPRLCLSVHPSHANAVAAEAAGRWLAVGARTRYDCRSYRGHEGKLCLIVVFVVQPYSRPIPGLSRELAAVVDVAAASAVVLAVTVVVDMALAVAAIMNMAMETTYEGVCF